MINSKNDTVLIWFLIHNFTFYTLLFQHELLFLLSIFVLSDVLFECMSCVVYIDYSWDVNFLILHDSVANIVQILQELFIF